MLISESRRFIADFVLYDVEKDKPLFISQTPTMNPDGSLRIVTVSDPEDETAVIHTLFAGRFNAKGEPVDVEGNVVEMDIPEKSSIIVDDNSGELVGLDGQKLT